MSARPAPDAGQTRERSRSQTVLLRRGVGDDEKWRVKPVGAGRGGSGAMARLEASGQPGGGGRGTGRRLGVQRQGGTV